MGLFSAVGQPGYTAIITVYSNYLGNIIQGLLEDQRVITAHFRTHAPFNYLKEKVDAFNKGQIQVIISTPDKLRVLASDPKCLLRPNLVIWADGITRWDDPFFNPLFQHVNRIMVVATTMVHKANLAALNYLHLRVCIDLIFHYMQS